MRIDHIALWAKDIKKMASFYEQYFQGKAGKQYHNPAKNFSSQFITFENGCRIELMHNPDISEKTKNNHSEQLGLIHLAISVGSKENVDYLTTRLQNDGFTVVGNPRTTGDGYYESVVLDPEQNKIEITI